MLLVLFKLILSFKVYIIHLEASYALNSFKVETLKGGAFFKEKALKEGQKIKRSGLLRVSKNSFLGVTFPEWNARLVLALELN